jgi:hypothetical protein
MSQSGAKRPSTRPVPPPELCEPAEKGSGLFVPAPELEAWARLVFLDESSPLYSETHEDIQDARIGWLWTSEPNERSGRVILGEAALARPPQALSGWNAALYRAQLRDWFASWWEGEPADFKIVLSAPDFAQADDASALVLVKHELLHCRQKVDRFGAPRFNQETGRPEWGMRREQHELAAKARGRVPLTKAVARLALSATAEALIGFPLNQIPTEPYDLRGQLDSVLDLVASALMSIDLAGPDKVEEVAPEPPSPENVRSLTDYLKAHRVPGIRRGEAS